MYRFIIIVLLVLLSATANAENYHQVKVYEEKAESIDAFVLSVTKGLVQKTQFLKSEMCGTIEQNGDTYRLEVYTSKKFQECNMPRKQGVMIHTHPKVQGNDTFSPHDLKIGEGYLVVDRKVLHQRDGVIRQVRR